MRPFRSLPAGLRAAGTGALALAATATLLADFHEVARFPIGGGDARYDYVRIDPENRRLYVSHDKVFEVLDADSGAKLGRIGPTSRAHGVAIATGFGHGFATRSRSSP
jgi:hypothetical protein